jgi:hypothetical protein
VCSKHNELQVAGVWNAKDELPIEIDLPQECRYHSVFACPILRQQVRYRISGPRSRKQKRRMKKIGCFPFKKKVQKKILSVEKEF